MFKDPVIDTYTKYASLIDRISYTKRDLPQCDDAIIDWCDDKRSPFDIIEDQKCLLYEAIDRLEDLRYEIMYVIDAQEEIW